MNKDPRRIVDEYLTRIARKAWPSASVTVSRDSDDSKDYRLEVPGEKPFLLGSVFGPARAMLRAIVYEHLPPEANRAEFTFEAAPQPAGVRGLPDGARRAAVRLVPLTG